MQVNLSFIAKLQFDYMKLIRKIFISLGVVMLIPASYFLIAIIASAIPVHENSTAKMGRTAYLSTNGVHLNFVFHREDLSKELRTDLVFESDEDYCAFGWGDANFYLQTPEWSDLTFGNASRALFMQTPSLMHVTRYQGGREHWRPFVLSAEEMESLQTFIYSTFERDSSDQKVLLEGAGYGYRDDFYKAKGNYHLFNTCNTWVNRGLKHTELRACLWTPFDFGLLWHYPPE